MPTSVAVEVSSDVEALGGNGFADRVAVLTAAADPVRLALLDVLASGPTCVCQLQAVVPVGASLLSYHLKVLREARLIEGRRRGRWIDYALIGDALERLSSALPASHPAPVGSRT